nr:hypothetical protein [Actinacidiphila yeochonensis]
MDDPVQEGRVAAAAGELQHLPRLDDQCPRFRRDVGPAVAVVELEAGRAGRGHQGQQVDVGVRHRPRPRGRLAAGSRQVPLDAQDGGAEVLGQALRQRGQEAGAGLGDVVGQPAEQRGDQGEGVVEVPQGGVGDLRRVAAPRVDVEELLAVGHEPARRRLLRGWEVPVGPVVTRRVAVFGVGLEERQPLVVDGADAGRRDGVVDDDRAPRRGQRTAEPHRGPGRRAVDRRQNHETLQVR